MIISHRHKFIFLKTSKTAGTSVEIALSKHCGPQDVITRISANDEELRQSFGHPGPQNYRVAPWKWLAADMMEKHKGIRRKAKKHHGYYNHIGADEVRLLAGKRVFSSYFKFCFVRNPWDRIASQYYYSQRNEDEPQSFEEFLQAGEPKKLRRTGWDLYTIGGEPAVDRVCKYENLEDELEAVRRELGIDEPLELPKTKSSHRPDKKSYEELFGGESPGWIYDLFKEEIELFGYEF